MNNTNKVLVGALGVVVLVFVAYFLMGIKNTSAPVTKNESVKTMVQPSVNVATTGKNYEVIYTDAGYSPKEITIKAGDTVTWNNQSSGGMWTASGMHPSHVMYSGTSMDEHCPDTSNTAFDECVAHQKGESWSFTFTKAGTWRYHNHINASRFGSVVVQ